MMVEGQSSEELKSANHHDLRTSEGAKRYQQHLCGPFVAMSFNFVISVAIIMTNKLVLSKVGFKFPILLTLIHYLTAWLLMAIFKALSLLPVCPPKRTAPFSSLFSLGLVMSFASGLSNASLRLNSVGFYQMAKIAVTPTIVVAEFILLRKLISYKRIISLVVVSMGVGIATVSDLKFNLVGACIAIAWIIPSAINKILWSNLQQQSNWTALALMWKTTPITVTFLLGLLPLLDPPGALVFKWDLFSTTAILISALLGFLLQWSGALALGATSATSHVVLGQFKTCVVILGGSLLLSDDPGVVSLVGVAIALVGMTVYTFVSMKEGEEQKKSQLNKQFLPLLKPKTEAEGSIHQEGDNNENSSVHSLVMMKQQA